MDTEEEKKRRRRANMRAYRERVRARIEAGDELAIAKHNARKQKQAKHAREKRAVEREKIAAGDSVATSERERQKEKKREPHRVYLNNRRARKRELREQSDPGALEELDKTNKKRRETYHKRHELAKAGDESAIQQVEQLRLTNRVFLRKHRAKQIEEDIGAQMLKDAENQAALNEVNSAWTKKRYWLDGKSLSEVFDCAEPTLCAYIFYTHQSGDGARREAIRFLVDDGCPVLLKKVPQKDGETRYRRPTRKDCVELGARSLILGSYSGASGRLARQWETLMQCKFARHEAPVRLNRRTGCGYWYDEIVNSEGEKEARVCKYGITFFERHIIERALELGLIVVNRMNSLPWSYNNSVFDIESKILPALKLKPQSVSREEYSGTLVRDDLEKEE